MRRTQKRKVSYVITHNKDDHGHLLGINSLALDTTTFNSSSGKPEGILYSAGRDGVINSWDLHLPLRKQSIPKYSSLNGINGVGEGKGGDEKVNDDDNVPLQKFSEVNNWGIDEDVLTSQPTPKSTFRQSFQSHTDWVNDIILCHNNETLISCSSDRTMKLWHPHKTSIPYTIGYHTDYIKALAYAPGPGWVASGGFDRKIALWDMKECRPASSSASGGNSFVGLSERDFQPIVILSENSPKSSVYALACNPSGSILVSGSPEKVIKVWDPKSGKRITKLSGHTDNIRAILISDDGELILTGSSDTTIKLWSLSRQRCINTFTTHSDSIWSLYSDHPRLEVFYAGSKDGLITRTDYSGYGYEEIGDGECIAVCKEDEGVVKLVTFDNKYIWTASYRSNIKRWQDVSMRKNRKFSVSSSPPPTSTSFQHASIQPSSLIKLTSADVTSLQSHTSSLTSPSLVTTSADSEVATIYSVPIDNYSDVDYEDPIPVREKADHIIEGQHGLIKHVILNNRRNILTLDNNGEVSLWDIIKCVRVKVFGKCNIDEIAQEINTPESIPNWCSVDTRIGALTIHLDESKCFDAETYLDEVEQSEIIETKEDQRINLGKWVLKYLFARFTQAEIKTYEEINQQRMLMQRQQSGNSLFSTQINVNIPPQAATSSTCTSPTSTSPTTANHNSISSNINPPITQSPTTPLAAFTTGPFTAPAATNSQQGDYFSGSHHLSSPTTSPTTPRNSNDTTAEERNGNGNGNIGTSTSTNNSSVIVTTTIQPPPPAFVNQNTNNSGTMGGIMTRLKHTVIRGNKISRNDKSEGTNSNEGSNVGNTTNSNTNKNTTSAGSEAKQRQSQENTTQQQQTNDDLATTNLSSSQNISTSTLYHSHQHYHYPIRQMHPLIQPPFANPTNETPEIQIPQHTTIIISEESHEASTNVDLYRGTVDDMERDAEIIEHKAPTWLIEFLIKNKIPPKEPVKISFILKPHEGSELDELPNGNSRLTANRMLRARKILGYIVEKLELNQPSINGNSVTESTANEDNVSSSMPAVERIKKVFNIGGEQEANTNNTGQNTTTTEEERNNSMKPELWLELICQDQVLLPTTTLATIRSHIWKSAGDLTMTYRLKVKSV